MTAETVPLAGVFGSPIGHSLSPLLHNHWLQSLGIKGHYIPLECSAEDLPTVLPTLLKIGFRGFNVTSPHKEKIFSFADHVTQRAQVLGAINTIWLKDGELYGDTTDGQGFLASLPEACDLSRCVIIGAGGAAKAIAYALCQVGEVEDLIIVNRTPARSDDLMATLKSVFPSQVMSSQSLAGPSPALENATLVINCTSLGMTGKPPLELDLSGCNAGTLIYDTVYSPAQTKLMQAAVAAGLPVIGGLGMLIEQGRPGFAHWFGAPAPKTGEEATLLQRALGQNR